ncbi:MAG: hypothetical protein ABIQ01_04005 [Pseudolysinimonas sp.]
MSESSHHTAVVRRSIVPAVIAVLLAVGAVVLMYYSFVNGISAALGGSEGDNALFIALFFIGAGIAVIAAVIGIVGLVRGGHRILSSLAVLIAIIPGIAIVLLRFANS